LTTSAKEGRESAATVAVGIAVITLKKQNIVRLRVSKFGGTRKSQAATS